MRDDLRRMTDEQLITACRAGDKYAEEQLISRYSGLVHARARQFYFTVGVEESDLVQEGRIGLWNAITSFEPGRSPFAAFAKRCVLARVLSAVRAAGRDKNRPINEGVPIEEGVLNGLAESPEDIYLAAERVEELKQSVLDVLSAKEKEVFLNYLKGMTYREIAQKMRCDEKSVDNAIVRIRKKAAGVRAK